MKKIIFVSLILFLAIFKVDAKEIYYSDYSDFSDYTLERIDSSELVNVEIERRYRFYDKQIVGEYRSFLDDNSNFKFFDLNNKKDSEYSGWSEEKPLEIDNRVIESKIFYKVKRPKPINHIAFMNTLGGNLKLNNIEVYYLGEKINYELIHDNSDSSFNIYALGTLTLDLKQYYDLENISVQIKSIEFNNMDEVLVLAAVPSENKLYDVAYFSYNLNDSITKNIVIDADDWIRGNAQYQEEVLVDYNPISEHLSRISPINLYRYKDPLFYFYNIENKYIDGYFKEYSNLNKDESDYKDYYRYQTRDKFEVEENIVITDYNQELSDFVNSTVDYEFITNLNLDKNGIYQVEYKTPFINIKKEVLVSIEENDYKLNEQIIEIKLENEKLNNELNNLKDKNDNLSKELDEIKKLNNELNKELVEMNDKNNYLTKEFSQIKKEKVKLDEKLVEEKNKNEQLNIKIGNILNNYNSLSEQMNITSDKYNNLLSRYELLKQEYQDIFNKKEEEKINCEQKLEEALLRVDDSDKKLKLSEQANKYLENSLLQIDNNGSLSIKKGDWFWLILVLVILFILSLIFLKKLSNKNKF